MYLRDSSATELRQTATSAPADDALSLDTDSTAYSRHASLHFTSTRSSFCKSMPMQESSSWSVPSTFRVRTADETCGMSPTYAPVRE